MAGRCSKTCGRYPGVRFLIGGADGKKHDGPGDAYGKNAAVEKYLLDQGKLLPLSYVHVGKVRRNPP